MHLKLIRVSVFSGEDQHLRKRKTYDDNFKARVALEAIKGERTISEIAGQFEVHPNQIIKWKKQLLENVSSLYSKKKDPEIDELRKLVEELYKKIGQQNIELEFLKKKYRQIQKM
jgi:transposase